MASPVGGCTLSIIDSSLSDIKEFPKDLFTDYQLSHGAITVHIIASVYMFYLMYIVCEEYLVPAIESLCDVLNLPSHIAGASFLAAASSVPELFVNIIGTFLTKDDLGIGTILASSFFNSLAVTALTGFGTALFGTKILGVHYNTISVWPLSRDAIAYSIALISLGVVVWDQKVYWYEALVMLLMYCLYVYSLTFNHALERLALKFGQFITNSFTKSNDEEMTPVFGSMEKTEAEETNDEKVERVIAEHDKEDHDLILKALEDDSNALAAERTQGKWTQLYPPRDGSCFDWFRYVIIFPAKFLLILTVPECRGQENRHWFPITLIVSVSWMGSLTYVASWMLTRFGATLGFPSVITGIFLGIGSSSIEVISSFIVARKGFGSMSISNSIGSNTFDILFCLGLP